MTAPQLGTADWWLVSNRNDRIWIWIVRVFSWSGTTECGRSQRRKEGKSAEERNRFDEQGVHNVVSLFIF